MYVYGLTQCLEVVTLLEKRPELRGRTWLPTSIKKRLQYLLFKSVYFKNHSDAKMNGT